MLLVYHSSRVDATDEPRRAYSSPLQYIHTPSLVMVCEPIYEHHVAYIVFRKPSVIIIITQTAAIALEPLTTHPDEWAEPSHK